jgi:hypothetical protein
MASKTRWMRAAECFIARSYRVSAAGQRPSHSAALPIYSLRLAGHQKWYYIHSVICKFILL